MAIPDTPNVQSLASFVWSIAEILRGDFKQSEYGKVILPFVVLRRLDCILEPTKDAVVKAHAGLPKGVDDQTRDMMLSLAAGEGMRVYNYSAFTFAKLKGQDPAQLHDNLMDYITKFSPSVRDVFLDKFLFTDQLKRLKEGALLWQVFDRFAQIDLRPGAVTNLAMGYLFEDLIRRFSEISNETAGEHFTPREVIRLIVDLLLINDGPALTGTGIIRQVYDPACGTGGMLALTEEAMRAMNPRIRVELFGQELNGESFGICKSDMLVTGHDPEQIAFGNTLTHDAHKGKRFHYMLCNPPYGVDWKKYQDPIKDEAERLGKDGRFGAGLPRISDGQLLFLQHMISKMRDDEAGSRIGIVMNGSPLFTGGAGSGESEIRRWMLENDWVEAIVALPTDLFYNTGISTYVWLLTNRKAKVRRGKVQLIDASGERFWKSMRKSLGSKRREIPPEARDTIVQIFHDMANGGGEWSDVSKIFDTEDFGYREIRIERPLQLSFQATPERIEKLKTEKPILRLHPTDQEALLSALSSLPGTLIKNRDAFEKALGKVLKAAGVKIAAPVKKAIDSDEGLLPESFETYQIVDPGNIVLRLTDLQNDKRSLRQGLVHERGIITAAYDAVEVGAGGDPRFWAYAFLALDLAKYYYSLGGGVRQSLKFKDFPNDWIGVPNFPTQSAIADFLDFLRFEQVNREILDEDMSEMLRNNPPDVVYSAFSQAFFQGAIRLFQRENRLQDIVMTDPEVRNQAIRHFFNRALREVRDEPRLPPT